MKCEKCGHVNGTAKATDRDLIDFMLAEVEGDLEDKGRENEFIASLREQFDAGCELTVKQIEGLRRFYENV